MASIPTHRPPALPIIPPRRILPNRPRIQGNLYALTDRASNRQPWLRIGLYLLLKERYAAFVALRFFRQLVASPAEEVLD
jgi:hypothetical protein